MRRRETQRTGARSPLRGGRRSTPALVAMAVVLVLAAAAVEFALLRQVSTGPAPASVTLVVPVEADPATTIRRAPVTTCDVGNIDPWARTSIPTCTSPTPRGQPWSSTGTSSAGR